MDLKSERSPDDKTHALGEVMANAVFLRNFLSDAVNLARPVAATKLVLVTRVA
jgi:hypothetical protein